MSFVCSEPRDEGVLRRYVDDGKIGGLVRRLLRAGGEVGYVKLMVGGEGWGRYVVAGPSVGQLPAEVLEELCGGWVSIRIVSPHSLLANAALELGVDAPLLSRMALEPGVLCREVAVELGGGSEDAERELERAALLGGAKSPMLFSVGFEVMRLVAAALERLPHLRAGAEALGRARGGASFKEAALVAWLYGEYESRCVSALRKRLMEEGLLGKECVVVGGRILLPPPSFGAADPYWDALDGPMEHLRGVVERAVGEDTWAFKGPRVRLEITEVCSKRREEAPGGSYDPFASPLRADSALISRVQEGELWRKEAHKDPPVAPREPDLQGFGQAEGVLVVAGGAGNAGAVAERGKKDPSMDATNGLYGVIYIGAHPTPHTDGMGVRHCLTCVKELRSSDEWHNHIAEAEHRWRAGEYRPVPDQDGRVPQPHYLCLICHSVISGDKNRSLHVEGLRHKRRKALMKRCVLCAYVYCDAAEYASHKEYLCRNGEKWYGIEQRADPRPWAPYYRPRPQ